MSEWKSIELCDVAKVTMGQSPSSTTYNESGIGLPFLQGCADFGSKYPIKKVYCSAPLKIVDSGSALISVRAPVGTMNIANARFCIGRGLAGIQGISVDQVFLNYLISANTFKLDTVSQGSTFLAVNSDDLNHLKLSIPTSGLAQRKIATILNTVDKVIEMTEAAIEKYKAIKAGMMQDLFTRGIDVKTGKLRPSFQEAHELYKETELGWIPKEWEVRLIKDFSKIVSGSTPTTNNEEYWNGEINWITPADMSKIQHQYFSDTDRRITTKGMLSCSATLLPENSIVMSSRAPIGYFAIGLEPFTTNQGCKSFNLTEGQNAEYQYYNMLHNVGLFLRLGSGSTFAEITKSQIEKIMLPIAIDHNEQNAIGSVSKVGVN